MARSRESLRQSGIMDSSLERALKVRPFPQMPTDYLEHREARAAHLRTMRHMMAIPGPIPDLVSEKELSVQARDGFSVRVKHYAPVQPRPTSSPLIVLFHEGGWGMGDLSDEEFNARHLVRDLGAVCLNVEYRLAPEHQFPTWINDCWDVLKWAASNASSLDANPTHGFIVGGSSAGGNIAAILAHRARNEKLSPPVTGQWLSVPYLIPGSEVPERYKDEYISMTENLIDPVLTGGIPPAAEADRKKRTGADPTSPLFSVVAPEIYPPTEENLKLKGPLAAAFIQVAGLDPLRDHGLIYDRILRLEYGTDTRVKLYPGFGHMFWTNWPELDMSKQFATDMIDGIRWLLDQ